MKIALIGDSILDNELYTGINGSVFTHVQKLFPKDNILNLAVDGSTIDDLEEQLAGILKPRIKKWDYAFLSIGGNNLINDQKFLINATPQELKIYCNNLGNRINSVYYQLSLSFKKIILLKMYQPTFDGFDQEFKNIAYSAINRVNSTSDVGMHFFPLTNILKEIDDFTNVIEPSEIGSIKIANLIKGIIDGLIPINNI